MQPPKVLELYLEITRYPILAKTIRAKMREALFAHHVIDPQVFEQEVAEKAIQSQILEGIQHPYEKESPEVWQERLQAIRDNLTDFYFAYHFPHSAFVEIVQPLLRQRTHDREVVLTFNAELAPWEILFAKGEEYEKYPPEEKAKIMHHLEEITVVLIKGMISDQLSLVGVAKRFFTMADLKEIRRRRIGRGRIGGKAAGLLLAYKVLQHAQDKDGLDLQAPLVIPDSYFIGADVFYDVHQINALHDFHNQKYKSSEEIIAEYPQVIEAMTNARFPEEVTTRLREILTEIGPGPIIVRSSSLLEDNIGSAFAGKYDSFFCPNQGTAEENLAALSLAIKRVYASVYNPNALLYRRQKKLVDYDERMAILIQKVAGYPHGQYYFPDIAGVGFSRNPFRWSRQIRREDGFLRLVWGMGTRAVDRMANDYPRMVALSHPHLRPEKGAAEIRKYSQHCVDAVDLSDNRFKSLPVEEVISSTYPGIRLLAALDHGDYMQPIFALGPGLDPRSLVLTFDGLVQNKTFTSAMKAIMKTLEHYYNYPVDIEFAVDITSDRGRPQFKIHLLQCRPFTSQIWGEELAIPTDIAEGDKIFSAHKMVPQGVVSGIQYAVYVDPNAYSRIPDRSIKSEVARVIGRLNKRLEGKRFILLGPGRWGSSDIDLGVKVSYADIYNTKILVEIAMEKGGETPEVSYGTHFFQDLVESEIYPLPLYPNDNGAVFNSGFLNNALNVLKDLLPDAAAFQDYVKVIDIPAATDGRTLEVIMNAQQEEALGYLKSS
jgi:Pyruvate phosphate dikinase, AMP/ATP-binding domain